MLIEVAVAYVILIFALVCLVPVFIMGVKSNKATEKVQTATYLSAELLEEIKMRKWDENTPANGAYTGTYSTTMGVDSGETATDKTTFDDIDDFNGYTESPPKNPMGVALSALSAFSRSVVVQYVDATLNPTASLTASQKTTVRTQI